MEWQEAKGVTGKEEEKATAEEKAAAEETATAEEAERSMKKSKHSLRKSSAGTVWMLIQVEVNDSSLC